MEYAAYEQGPGICDEFVVKYKHVAYGYELLVNPDGVVKVVPIGVAPPLGDTNA